MKQSNITTPRTLADCDFRTGYHCGPHRESRAGEVWYVIATIAVFAFIGVILAWRG